MLVFYGWQGVLIIIGLYISILNVKAISRDEMRRANGEEFAPSMSDVKLLVYLSCAIITLTAIKILISHL